MRKRNGSSAGKSASSGLSAMLALAASATRSAATPYFFIGDNLNQRTILRTTAKRTEVAYPAGDPRGLSRRFFPRKECIHRFSHGDLPESEIAEKITTR